MSAAAILSLLCFVAGVALLGTSHAAGYLYAASALIGAPVFFALQPWKTSIPWPVRLYTAVLLGFLLLCVFDVVFREAGTSVLDRKGRLLLGLINGYFFFLLLKRRQDALFTLIVMIASAQASVSILTTLAAGIDFQTWAFAAERLGGHAQRAIPFALMHISAAGIFVLVLVDGIRPGRKALLLGLAAVVLAASLLANVIGGSRGPLLAMPLLFVLTAVVIWMRLGPGWGIGMLVAGMAGVIAAAGVVFQREPESLQLVHAFMFGPWGSAWADSNTGIRLELWRLSLQLIPEAPLLGHGLGAWPEVLRHPAVDVGADAFILNFGHPHNEYLNLLVKLGIVGTALFFAPMAIALAGARRLWVVPEKRIQAIVVAWFVGAHLIYGLTDIYSEWSTNCLFLGVFLGMMIWLVPERVRRPHRPPPKLPRPHRPLPVLRPSHPAIHDDDHRDIAGEAGAREQSHNNGREQELNILIETLITRLVACDFDRGECERVIIELMDRYQAG